MFCILNDDDELKPGKKSVWRMNGAPERIRTSDLLIRSQSLYPAELRAHILWNTAKEAIEIRRLRTSNIPYG